MRNHNKMPIRGGKMGKGNKAQSILEYVIVLTVIIAAIIFAATKFIKPAAEKAMEDAATAITDATGKLTK